LESIGLLVSLGADVNAVAEHDVMPLNVAHSLPESAERLEIVNKLLSWLVVLSLIISFV
jgi:hypothetical protein